MARLQSSLVARSARNGTLAVWPGAASTSSTYELDGRRDVVAAEEFLEIRVDGEPLAVAMRPPPHDEELALGFLFGEGLIDARPRRAGLSPHLAQRMTLAGFARDGAVNLYNHPQRAR